MELKENWCRLEFYCKEPKKKDCVYFSKTHKHEDCKYMNGLFCESAVAQVNIMTLAIKERKGEL